MEITVDLLENDILDLAHCMLIDAESFPASALQFGIELGRASSRLWVGRDGPLGRPLGFLASRMQSGELYVIALAVDPAHRRHGIGRDLLSEAIRFAGRRRIASIRLHVAKGNAAALALYRAAGFEAKTLRREYYPSGEDAYEMVLAVRAPIKTARR